MEVFLPIAQVFINPIEILLLSALVGILSGLFGVGGGFLMTPFLIFLGVPPAYAVANEANNILATSVSGSTTHYLKNTLDYKMGLMIVVGGTIGTTLGIYTFSYFHSQDHHCRCNQYQSKSNEHQSCCRAWRESTGQACCHECSRVNVIRRNRNSDQRRSHRGCLGGVFFGWECVGWNCS